MITEYIKSFDHDKGAWSKKQEATAFGDFLAAELGINRKGVVHDKDGPWHRIRVPLVAAYWHPLNAQSWEQELHEMKRNVKGWVNA